MKRDIIDLGCGEGFLYEYFYGKNLILKPHEPKERNYIADKKAFIKSIKSFDIISLKRFITKADIKQLPLANKSSDIAIFCLALMGVNYLEFLIEANRCLKIHGFLIISEVASRIPSFEIFCKMIEVLGFTFEEKVKTIPFYKKNYIFINRCRVIAILLYLFSRKQKIVPFKKTKKLNL